MEALRNAGAKHRGYIGKRTELGFRNERGGSRSVLGHGLDRRLVSLQASRVVVGDVTCRFDSAGSMKA